MLTLSAPRQTEVKPTEAPAEGGCGSCYGAQANSTHCCNTCQDIIDAYREKRWNPDTEKFEQCKKENYVDKEGQARKLALNEGCQIYGYMEVNRVSLANSPFLSRVRQL